MKKTLAYILSIGGLISSVYFLIKYMNQTESFGVFGADVVVSQGNSTPLIVSIAVLVIGIILLATSKK